MMHERVQTLASGAILALIVGWVLYIGKDVFVPIVFGVLLVYVIVGLTRLLGKVPLVGPKLSSRTRHALSILIIAFVVVEVVYLVIASKDSVAALAPQYQESLLVAIQRIAAYFRIESEPTWSTLRRDLLAQIDTQRVVGSMVASVSSLFVSIVVVVLYASFLLLEQRTYAAKLANLSSDPRTVARVRELTGHINARIGSYLALKTFLGILLGVVSWMAMAFVGLEFAAFWAALIALLNYVPYIGSFLGIAFPVGMAIVQFANPGDVIAVLVPLVVVHFIIGNILDPYVMGNSLNLSPFAIVVSLAVWTALWGIPGAFVAVPITAIMTIVFSEFSGTRPIAVLLSRNGRLE